MTEIKLSNEFDPIWFQDSSFARTLVTNLQERPDKVQRVYIRGSIYGTKLGDFFINALPPTPESNIRFIAQGFSNLASQDYFLEHVPSSWKPVQPGIFLLELNY